MERPEIIGWQVTTNEKGIQMATLPLHKMHEIVEYLKYAEIELKKLRVGDVSGSLQVDECQHQFKAIEVIDKYTSRNTFVKSIVKGRCLICKKKVIMQ